MRNFRSKKLTEGIIRFNKIETFPYSVDILTEDIYMGNFMAKVDHYFSWFTKRTFRSAKELHNHHHSNLFE